MKVAILSDIHGNLAAFKAVLHDIDSLNINKFLIAGDFVGYYYRVKGVLEALRSRDIIACRGNHEDIFQKWCTASVVEQKKLKDKYGSGLEVAHDELTVDQKEWLFSLKHPVFEIIDQKRFCVAHGAPWDIDEYVYFDRLEQLEDEFSQISEHADVIVLGHTHYPYVKKINNLTVINPGSVGQPRSGRLVNEKVDQIVRAHWAIIETTDLTVSLKTTFYDASLLFQEIDTYDFAHPYLKNVFYRTE